MTANITGLLPNITNSLVNKVLFLEVYFLLKTGKSPAYFSLVDFVDSYSIELFYIAVLFVMLASSLMLPALAFFYFFSGILSWSGNLIMRLVKIEGIPIFRKLDQHRRKNSVSLGIAIDFAKSKPDPDLKKRIEEYEKTTQERFSNEVLATTNFVLVGLIFWISYSTGAPNFLMKVSRFVDSFSYGLAYEMCLVLLAIQGFVGRASSFHLFHASGNLPPNFFDDEDERAKVAAWDGQLVEKKMPLAQKWMKGNV